MSKWCETHFLANCPLCTGDMQTEPMPGQPAVIPTPLHSTPETQAAQLASVPPISSSPRKLTNSHAQAVADASKEYSDACEAESLVRNSVAEIIETLQAAREEYLGLKRLKAEKQKALKNLLKGPKNENSRRGRPRNRPVQDVPSDTDLSGGSGTSSDSTKTDL